MAFVLQDVIEELEKSRSRKPLKKLQKKNLVKVAAHFGATKSHILGLIEDCCKIDKIDSCGGVQRLDTFNRFQVLTDKGLNRRYGIDLNLRF